MPKLRLRPTKLNILIVKLSSLGDVVHTLPAVQDIRVAGAACGGRTPRDSLRHAAVAQTVAAGLHARRVAGF
jgi:hypothetical protein